MASFQDNADQWSARTAREDNFDASIDKAVGCKSNVSLLENDLFPNIIIFSISVSKTK